MIILKQNRSAASYTDYHGFTLQPGYWFGHDDETGEYVASSGWEVNHDLALYRRNQVTGEWEMSWVDQDETEIVASGFAVPDLAAKKTFKQWLKEDYGVEPEDYDEHYCGTFADEVESDYEDYINDGLRFLRAQQQIWSWRQKMKERALRMQAWWERIKSLRIVTDSAAALLRIWKRSVMVIWPQRVQPSRR